jgi:hypothetical protein
MITYDTTLTGDTELLLHHDNIDWADFMDEWKNDPGNKKASKAGDDRTPPWRWLGCLYHDGEHVAMPQANIMRCIMEGGGMVPTGGKNGKTFKSQTQSGMMCGESFWRLTVKGKQIPYAGLELLREETSFAANRKMAQSYGFDLLVKRAKIGMAKHIRVRPVLAPGWILEGTLQVWDEMITPQALENILSYSGQYKGLGDWRPGGKTPGPFGRFSAKIKKR